VIQLPAARGHLYSGPPRAHIAPAKSTRGMEESKQYRGASGAGGTASPAAGSARPGSESLEHACRRACALAGWDAQLEGSGAASPRCKNGAGKQQSAGPSRRGGCERRGVAPERSRWRSAACCPAFAGSKLTGNRESAANLISYPAGKLLPGREPTGWHPPLPTQLQRAGAARAARGVGR